MDDQKEDWRSREGIKRRLNPKLSDGDLKILKKIIKSVAANSSQPNNGAYEPLVARLREYVENQKEKKSEQLLAVMSVFADLFEQGWSIFDGENFILELPSHLIKDGESPQSIKDRIRTYLKSGQKRQLQEDSVQSFMRRIFNVSSRSQGKHSIASVIDNGDELGEVISKASAMSIEERDDFLAKHIKPEIEICESDSICSETGLRHLHIWRFFRHTWLTEYRPIPGRQMPILIRNAARKNKPIMGIAMLASPVMKLKIRDKWIGWDGYKILDDLFDGKIDRHSFIHSMYNRIDKSISEIRWDDLLSEDAIRNPTIVHFDRLGRETTKANLEREKLLKEIHETDGVSREILRDPQIDNIADEECLELSQDNLFVAKRASTLSELLRAKELLKHFDLLKNPDNLRTFATSKDGEKLLEIVLSEYRKEGLASQVMDISVCGAVPPYGGLLVGKLVTLLLSSSEIDEAFKNRYGKRPSIIASQMAGRRIIRDASLRILTTTSLFGIGTSQYNRLVLRKKDHHGIPNDIVWEQLGEQSAGYGTIHLSNTTQQLLREVAIEKHGARRINSKFGEGTSSRMRQAREGLGALGLESSQVLHHAMPRIVLGCKVEEDASEVLLGLSKPTNTKKPSVASLSRAWRRRWLLRRVESEEVQSRVKNEGPEFLRKSMILESKNTINIRSQNG